MVYKKCPYCKGMSYSSSPERKWICPYCNRDISKVVARPIRADLELVK